ncbi:agglutinin-2-like [Rhododendron vialii]|uniref:agglutinin-2-like n=1 Tax=Rhododendron vialii TaxID=182163 RepID=UPI00265FAFDD|nr:agglutinin-2-like [Rhododendron vialii]
MGAYISANGIQLTPDPNDYTNTSFLQYKIGRATYFQPLHLWDSAMGDLTDFSMNFSFLILGENYGEGITFFLSPNGSNIPPDLDGGGLGLVNENGTSTFVAVEFDTNRNTWETSFPINHVGININTMKSVKNQFWESGIFLGKKNEARIKYDSSTKNLSVVFT